MRPNPVSEENKWWPKGDWPYRCHVPSAREASKSRRTPLPPSLCSHPMLNEKEPYTPVLQEVQTDLVFFASWVGIKEHIARDDAVSIVVRVVLWIAHLCSEAHLEITQVPSWKSGRWWKSVVDWIHILLKFTTNILGIILTMEEALLGQAIPWTLKIYSQRPKHCIIAWENVTYSLITRIYSYLALLVM